MTRVLLELHDTETLPVILEWLHSNTTIDISVKIYSTVRTRNSLKGGGGTKKLISTVDLSPSTDTPVMFSVCDPGENLFLSNTNVPFSSAPACSQSSIMKLFRQCV